MTKHSQIVDRPRTKSVLRGLGGRIRPFLMALVLVCSLVGISYSSVAAAGTTYFVDKTNVACSDSGSGSSGTPFCTIGRGALAAGPGDTVQVVAGTYAETIEPSASGTSGSPILYTAAAGVIVTGNGTSSGSAFRFNGLSYITVNGFHIGPTAESGIYVSGTNANVILSNNIITGTTTHGIWVLSADHVTVSGNTVSTGATGGTGIYLNGVSASTVSGNTSHDNGIDGIRLTGCNGVTVTNNVTYSNLAAKANGIALIGSSFSITVLHNIVYANADSGIQVEASHDNVIVGNLSYHNGDHGNDVTNVSLNNKIIGNTYQGNYTSGLNVEASAANVGSTGSTIANNVLVDNGLNPGSGKKPNNLYVDGPSVTGTTVNYDLFWTTGSFQINWNGIDYSSLAAFKAAVPTQEVNGLQGNPLFVSAATPAVGSPPTVVTGDYHLSTGSAAIDNANSAAANWPSTDLDGLARVDDPSTPNTGAGSSLFDDRGAYEFHPGGAVAPTVTTEAVTAIGPTTATGHGTVTVLGSPNPTQHGVVWDIAANPTIALSTKTSDGPVGATGPFTSAITGLTAGVTYHVRAYATNTAGTSYGSDVNFTASTGTVTFTTSGTWTAPAGITTINVEVWGGGGRGGGTSGGFGEAEGGGGGGGAYAVKNNVTVVPGNNYSYVVGAGSTGTGAGGTSSFNTSTVIALGGNSAANTSGNGSGASGGAGASGTGDLKFSGGGGAGGSSSGNYGGGAGSSAGSALDGVTATNATGATAPTDGGNGGNGRSSSSGDGSVGTAPGGGGGGAYRSSGNGTNNGGNGAAGQVRITYVVPVASTTSVNCGAGTPVMTYGGPAINCVVTVTRSSGTQTPSGNVTWTSNVAGGTFVTSPCLLVAGVGGAASCPVTYAPSAVGAGTHVITASYPGDAHFLTSTGNQSVTVNTAAVAPVITASSKVYDGTLTAAILTRNLTGIIGTDVVTLTGGTATFDTKDVGAGKTVTGTGFTLGGAQAGNYHLAPVSATALADVTVKALTMSGLTVPASRIYDGTLGAVVSGTPLLAGAEAPGAGTTLDGKPYTGDLVGITGTALGAYNSKDVATAANVTFSGLTLNLAQATNYSLTIQSPAAATVTAKALTMSGLSVPASKIYDGTTGAVATGTPLLAPAEAPGPGTTLDGKPYTGDLVGITGTAVGTYNNKNVATAANVTFSGLSLNLAQATNYTLTIQSPAAATITAKALTMSGLSVPASKIYNGNLLAVVGGTPLLPAAEAPGAGTTLDGTPYTGDSASITGTAVGTYNSKDVATAASVTFSGLSVSSVPAGNYSLTIQSPAAATITAKALTLTGLTADNKVYDRLLGATLSGTPSLVGVVSPDDVTIGAGVPVASFADKTVANGKPVTVSGYTLNGVDKADYSLTQPTGLLANITAKPLTITGLTANNKVYDRLPTATLTGTAVPVGVISGDTVTIAGSPSANFADKLVADSKPVTVSGYTLAGADSLNYSVSQPAGLTANITPLGLTVSGVVAVDKVYNGNNVATLNSGGYALNTVIALDVVTLNSSLASGTFADKNIGLAKPVTALGFSLAGADSANYTLAQPTGLSASISQFTLTASATADPKPYDSTTSATVHMSTNKFGADAVTAAFTGASFSDANAGVGKTVSVTGITISGTDAANYHLLSDTASTTATISPAVVTVTANSRSKHITQAISFAGTEFTMSPATLFGSDTLTSVTLTSTGADAGAGTGDYPIVPNNPVVGSGLSNYALTFVNGTLTVKLNTAPIITEGASIPVSMSVNGKPTAFSLTLHATDADLDTITWAVTTPPAVVGSTASASGTGSSMVIHYTPKANYAGADHFTVQITDGFGGSASIVVNVTVARPILTLKSNAAVDGQVLESGENTNVGGALNATATTFNLGDDIANKQYRAILSFNTGPLPDTAVITSVTLKIKQQGVPVGANPFLTLGNIVVDIQKGNFGLASLQATDFQAIASKMVGLTFTNTPVAGWYTRPLAAANFTFVNKVGNTQFRLRFTKDDNNNHIADYLRFYSGNAPVASQPVLIIQYYVP